MSKAETIEWLRDREGYHEIEAVEWDAYTDETEKVEMHEALAKKFGDAADLIEALMPCHEACRVFMHMPVDEIDLDEVGRRFKRVEELISPEEAESDG